MATTFNVFSLGLAADLDTVEGNSQAENASALVGATFGSSSNPLHRNVALFAPGATGFAGGEIGRYDHDNSPAETFTIDGGAEQTFDGIAVYNATLTYVDGTTATITAVLFQDTAGNLYLAPETSSGSDQNALEAKPLEALTLDSVLFDFTAGLEADRISATYSGAVDGTAGNDTMSLGYTDADGDQITTGDDFIFGYEGDDSIDGDQGNDYIDSGAGNDIIDGGDGSDTIDGGDGNDTIYYGTGNDTVFGGAGADFIDDISGAELSGTDTIFGGSGDDVIYTGDGADTAYGGADADLIYAESGDDLVFGGAGNDTIDGGAGNDFIAGGAGTDTLDGGGSNDTIYGGDGNDSILGDAGDDVIYGDTYVLSLNDTGTDGRASISSFSDMPTNQVSYEITFSSTTPASNTTPLLSYAAGASDNELLLEVVGTSLVLITNDTSPSATVDISAYNLFDGNIHSVAFSWDSSSGAVEFYIDGAFVGTDTATTGALTAGGTFVVGQEQDSVGGGFSTTQILEGDVYQVALWDDIRTSNEFASDARSYGADQSDANLVANWFPDPLNGRMTDTQGTNHLTLAGDASIAETAGGDDQIDGGLGNDTLYGGAGNDTLQGFDGEDTLFGGSGNDTLAMGYGSTGETFDGGDGIDVVLIDGTEPDVVGGFAYDIDLAAGTDTYGRTYANIENIYGGGQDDRFVGTAGDNTLFGNGGNDTLTGGDGNDTLSGNAGNDTLILGAGNDVAVFDRFGGDDIISDFDLGDDNSDGFYNDQLDVSGLQNGIGAPVTTADVTVTDDGSGNARLSFPEGETITLQGVTPAQMSSPAQLYAAGIPCFTSGTPILTPNGPIPVELLKPGDRVLTRDNGIQTIRWVGQRLVTRAEMLANPKLVPVRVEQGVFGNESPVLYSQQHGILSTNPKGGGEHLVRATHLARLRGGGVRLAQGVRKVTYVHILFDSHQVVLSGGMWTESFYPGTWALKSLAAPEAQELAMLFPTLFQAEVREAYGLTARPIPPFKALQGTVSDFMVLD